VDGKGDVGERGGASSYGFWGKSCMSIVVPWRKIGNVIPCISLKKKDRKKSNVIACTRLEKDRQCDTLYSIKRKEEKKAM
jgi:hypothetical protein